MRTRWHDEGARMNDKMKQTTNMDPGVEPDTAEIKQLSPEIERHLGSKLQQAYGKILAEPMPEKFGALLKQLSKSETKS